MLSGVDLPPAGFMTDELATDDGPGWDSEEGGLYETSGSEAGSIGESGSRFQRYSTGAPLVSNLFSRPRLARFAGQLSGGGGSGGGAGAGGGVAGGGGGMAGGGGQPADEGGVAEILAAQPVNLTVAPAEVAGLPGPVVLASAEGWPDADTPGARFWRGGTGTGSGAGAEAGGGAPSGGAFDGAQGAGTGRLFAFSGTSAFAARGLGFSQGGNGVYPGLHREYTTPAGSEFARIPLDLTLSGGGDSFEWGGAGQAGPQFDGFSLLAVAVPSSVPEPSAVLLTAAGALVLAVLRRRGSRFPKA